MVHFEKGEFYSYDEIQVILNNTFDYVMEDLRKEQNKIDDEMGKMMFELHTMMILSLYKTALLKGVNEDNE